MKELKYQISMRIQDGHLLHTCSIISKVVCVTLSGVTKNYNEEEGCYLVELLVTPDELFYIEQALHQDNQDATSIIHVIGDYQLHIDDLTVDASIDVKQQLVDLFNYHFVRLPAIVSKPFDIDHLLKGDS